MRQGTYARLYRIPSLSFLLLVLLPNEIEGGSFEYDNTTLSRSGRQLVPSSYKYLVFPQGSNVQLIYCLTIGALAKPQGFFTLGVTAGLAYELPHRRSVPYRKPAEVYHRRSRRDLYRKLELVFNTQGKDGLVCVLRALCKAGKRNREQPVKSSFLEEILHSAFTYPEYADDDDEETVEQKLRIFEYQRAYNARGDCDELFPSDVCPRFF